MTMVTASTALTIFIMNIHHCGSEAHPVPQWAERFILNYLARICFVYEVGENCVDGTSSRQLSQMETEVLSTNGVNDKGASWDVNGKALGGRTDQDVAPKMDRDATSETDLFVTIDHSEEEGAPPACDAGKERSTSALGGGEEGQAEEKNATGREKKGGGAGGSGRGIFVRAQCVCQHQGLCRNIEYITSSYQDQRAAQLRIGEWRKVAKVMDRFFMWLFFIMVFIMSILILGKAI